MGCLRNNWSLVPYDREIFARSTSCVDTVWRPLTWCSLQTLEPVLQRRRSVISGSFILYIVTPASSTSSLLSGIYPGDLETLPAKMVRAWYMTDTDEDQREPHMPDPPAFLSRQQLKERTGAEFLQFNSDTWETDEGYAALKKERGYTYEDVCEISRETLPNYDEKLKTFFTEHIHSDEEIRFIVKGSGYFDLRDIDDKWVRIEVTKDDLLIVPAGIYHRFTLDTSNYIKVKRLFVGEPVWTPINRPGADEHPVRKDYLQAMTRVES